jgi:3-oxoacyl-[acyl-carrier protein] reductase
VSYVAAKAGLHGLTRVMSRELAAAGILTNVVMPGFTPADKQMPPHLLDKAREAAATRRVTHPDDVARMIVFLCSAANTNTTGEAVRTDGHFLSPA